MAWTTATQVIALALCAAAPCIASRCFSYQSASKVDLAYASATISDSGKRVTVRWAQQRKTYLQTLSLANGWTVWACDEQPRYLPSVVAWPQSGQDKIIIVVASTPSAAYGVRAPFIYSLHHHRWSLISDPVSMQFTNRGSFYAHGARLYLWDYEASSEQAHSASQRYWLKVFALRHDHLSLVDKRLTRERYLGHVDVESYAPPKQLPAHSDPLREFGLQWRWWGSNTFHTYGP